MTTAISKRTPIAEVTPPRITLELARFEAIRILRHPVTWIGVLVSIWLMWSLGGDVAPILERDSVFLAGTVLPLGAAALIVANFAVLRHRKDPETLDATPSDVRRRTLGVFLGLGAPVLLAGLVQGIGLVFLLMGGPIGTIDWVELAGGPAAVALLGAAGVFLGRRLPHPIVPLIALVALAMFQILSSPDAQMFSPAQPAANVEWLAPWMTPSAFSPIEELAFRPSLPHLGYVLVLALLLATFALPMGRPGSLIRLTMAGAFAAAVIAVSLSLPADGRSRFDWAEAAANQVCVEADSIEYCAFGFYEDWIPRWQHAVDAVDALAPVSVHTVLQRPPNISWDEPGTLEQDGLILANTSWDREWAVPHFRLALALRAALSSVGLPTAPELRPYTGAEIESIVAQNPGYPGDLRAQLEAEQPIPKHCSAFDQARAVLAVWLAGAALENGKQGLEEILRDQPPTGSLWMNDTHDWPVLISVSDARIAQTLLSLPVPQVRQELQERWDSVTDPATTSSDLASWFGLPAPEQQDPGYFVEPCR